MRELNESVVDRIADHAPMTVDLPVCLASSSNNRPLPAAESFACVGNLIPIPVPRGQ
jgi:hypothetical protein